MSPCSKDTYGQVHPRSVQIDGLLPVSHGKNAMVCDTPGMMIRHNGQMPQPTIECRGLVMLGVQAFTHTKYVVGAPVQSPSVPQISYPRLCPHSNSK